MKNFKNISDVKMSELTNVSQFTIEERNCKVTILSKDEKGVMYWEATTDAGNMKYKTNLYYMKKHLAGVKAGSTTKVTHNCKVENSQQSGEHKVTSVNSSKLGKQHAKVMKALHDLNSVFGYLDGINADIHTRWANYRNEIIAAEAEAEAKAKAAVEAKAKAKAEAEEAKKVAKAAKLLDNILQNIMSSTGCSRDEAAQKYNTMKELGLI